MCDNAATSTGTVQYRQYLALLPPSVEGDVSGLPEPSDFSPPDENSHLRSVAPPVPELVPG